MGYEVVGTWKQFFHWGPTIAVGIIFMITSVSVNCHIMWWPPHQSVYGCLDFLMFLTWVALTLYNYFAACLKGPGFVPLEWEPKNEKNKNYLQYCEPCQGYKAPRSHHCRKCGRCVMKMDHHCPWINTCCGHFNHGNFLWFLLFAPIGCLHAIVILIPSIYRALNFHYYIYYRPNEPFVYLGILGFVFTMFGIGLAIGVLIAVGMLFVIQLKSILRNQTGIEQWIVDKAYDRDRYEDEEEFVYPYDLGWKENLTQVINFSGRPKSNGFTWSVREDCNQFTLTIEQLKQKQEKRERTIGFTVKESYSGALCPITKGVRVACCIPCTDEPRLTVGEGDVVWVTRWKKRWLYGVKVVEETKNGKIVDTRKRGWFPRQCAIEITDDNMNDKKES